MKWKRTRKVCIRKMNKQSMKCTRHVGLDQIRPGRKGSIELVRIGPQLMD